MKLIELANTTVETFKTIKERRETERIFETKFYAISSALIGITVGIAIGIVVALIQICFPSLQDDTLMSVIIGASLLALFAFDVWLTYPIILDKSIAIMEKVMDGFVTLLLSFACFLLGVYGLIIVLILAICYIIFRIALPLMFEK